MMSCHYELAKSLSNTMGCQNQLLRLVVSSINSMHTIYHITVLIRYQLAKEICEIKPTYRLKFRNFKNTFHSIEKLINGHDKVLSTSLASIK